MTASDLPIDAEDLAQIEGMLAHERPFCSSFSQEPLYSVLLYHKQRSIHETESRMLLDRNVYSRLVGLARGRPVSAEHRIPAAILAFAQLADIGLEPSLALSEGRPQQTITEVTEELALFRALDNLHPSILVDFALGRLGALPSAVSVQPVTEDLASTDRRVRDFSLVYPLILKVGRIELGGGRQVDRMRQFLDWMHRDWYYSAPATLFAAMCFSGDTPGGALRNLRHQDRGRALQGLRAAAWDLTYVSYWGRMVRQQNQDKCLWLLCSMDKVLRAIAARLLAPDGDLEDLLCQSLIEIMGEAIGQPVFTHYAELKKQMGSPDRSINRTSGESRLAYHREMVDALEAAILMK